MAMNSVSNIKRLSISNSHNYEKKIELKKLGPPKPNLNITQQNYKTDRPASSKKNYTRKFNRNFYLHADWICGCEVMNSFFCYVCLVMNLNSDSAWTENGIKDLKHLGEKIKKHKISETHMNNCIEYSLLGKVNISCQLDSAYRLKIKQHNEEVSKNRYILSKLIDCVKFCGIFELALRGHDETNTSENPGIFRGLVNLMAGLDSTLKEHIEKTNNRVFVGLSKTIQNEILDSIYAVCIGLIKQEINETDYISIEADETTDCATLSQMVLVVRYELNGKLHERFISFVSPQDHSAEGISNSIFEELAKLELDKMPSKIIAQTYDGAAVMSGKHNGVQAKVKAMYKNAQYVHCYAHQLNLIIERAASQNKQVKIFFCNLDGFTTFFSRSSKRTAILDEVVKKRLPKCSNTRWNFKSRCVTTVFIHKNDIYAALEKITDDDESDKSTVHKAFGLKNILNNDDFNFWLTFFNKIMPACDILFNQLQQVEIDSIKTHQYVASFKSHIQNVRDYIDFDASLSATNDFGESSQNPKRSRFDESKKTAAKEVCDIIITNIDDRFSFSDHLAIAVLLQPTLFSKHQVIFPETQLQIAAKQFKLNETALRHELVVLYSRPDFTKATGTLVLLNFLYENNLVTVFPELVKLLKIICTIPMTTAESERCFSTLKRIKTFTRNTMKEDRLSALGMCSIEKKMLGITPNFNVLVIDHFAKQKERRIDFMFKQIN